ncbi:phospholipase D-like domain-containing protein [Superficieibacter electus]|uniref:phospholipase D-like domain-containing protein n=1 Tax=Superficieibacter electus TaxID=2022662 RepID=UPI00111329D0|nr:phospholipase D-like domain-containing protein [Superficieibacter electus]
MSDNISNCTIYFTDESEKSKMAHGTDMHWIHYTAKIDDKEIAQNFAQYTEGNQVDACLGGKAYYDKLLAEFGKAAKSIYITGWQVNWDALLEPGKRLVDALWEQVNVKPQLKVYIMPWKNSSVLETYTRATERVFAALNTKLGREAFYVRLAGQQSSIFFSHHQKCVIIDESVAFLGGIDLAYGRYDENTGLEGYTLKADAANRKGMNMYNSCVCYMEPLSSGISGEDCYDPRVEFDPQEDSFPEDRRRTKAERQAEGEKVALRIADAVLNPHNYQRPNADAPEKHSPESHLPFPEEQEEPPRYHWLDAGHQPRMPWQDYQVRIEGPAVDDLVRNFVWRWNSYGEESKKSELQTDKPHLTAPVKYPSPKPGTCQVQVLRSASLKMRNKEHDANSDAPAPEMKQDDIRRSMFQLISKAEHYIYIENQFFISAFGKPSIADNAPLSAVAKEISGKAAAVASKGGPGNSNAEPVNEIAEWLGDRITHAIYANMQQPFHVYIVLPVHAEGRLNDGPIVAQVHQTRQSLVFGSRSLLNRVRQALWVMEQLSPSERQDWYDKIPKKEQEWLDKELYKDDDFSACDAYVTLLNLRAWDNIGGVPVTEQVYVHSKLMIVDDRYVLVGSANINERSLKGDGDSELAVLVMDTEHCTQVMDDIGTQTPVRQFAQDLRMNAWRKILGEAAGEVDLEKPASAACWRAIRARAKANTNIYDEVFDFIPKDQVTNMGVDVSDQPSDKSRKEDLMPASLWPVYMAGHNNPKEAMEQMPFSENFWNNYKGIVKNADKLSGVKGYITLLPVHWTEGENNLIDYHAALIN